MWRLRLIAVSLQFRSKKPRLPMCMFSIWFKHKLPQVCVYKASRFKDFDLPVVQKIFAEKTKPNCEVTDEYWRLSFDSPSRRVSFFLYEIDATHSVKRTWRRLRTTKKPYPISHFSRGVCGFGASRSHRRRRTMPWGVGSVVPLGLGHGLRQFPALSRRATIAMPLRGRGGNRTTENVEEPSVAMQNVVYQCHARKYNQFQSDHSLRLRAYQPDVLAGIANLRIFVTASRVHYGGKAGGLTTLYGGFSLYFASGIWFTHASHYLCI